MTLTDWNEIQPGCYAKVVNVLFSGFYATVTNKSYLDEWEINYFQKQYGKWTIKDGDLDSCAAEDMILVTACPDKWFWSN